MVFLKTLVVLLFVAYIPVVVHGACQAGDPTFVCLATTAGATYDRCDGITANQIVTAATCPSNSYCIATAINGTKGAGDINEPPNGPCVASVLCSTVNTLTAVGPTACSAYFTCGATSVGSLAVINVCSGTDHFNSQTRTCMAPALAGCNPPSITTVTTTPTTPAATTPPATTPMTNTTTAPANNATTPSPTVTPLPTTVIPTTVAPPNCQAQGVGRYADQASCRHFYRCGIFGRLTRRRCPFSMRFDTSTSRCGFNANCGSRPIV